MSETEARYIVYRHDHDGTTKLAGEKLDLAAARAKVAELRRDPFVTGAFWRISAGDGAPVHYKTRQGGIAWCGHDFRYGTDPTGQTWWSPTSPVASETTCPACVSELAELGEE